MAPDPLALDEKNFPAIKSPVLPTKERVAQVSHTAGIAIIAAMIDAEGDEIQNEWVTIVNCSPKSLNLTGWSLNDCSGRPPRTLNAIIPSGETVRVTQLYNVSTKAGVKLSNRRGRLELADKTGVVVDRVEWTTRTQRIDEGVPVSFHTAEDSIPSVRIVAALINAPGDERKNEWVNVLNASKDIIDLTGWTLSDETHHQPWPLDGVVLKPGQSRRFQSMYLSESGPSVQLGNRRGTIVLRNAANEEVHKVSYESEKKFKQGIPKTFIMDKNVAIDGFGNEEPKVEQSNEIVETPDAPKQLAVRKGDKDVRVGEEEYYEPHAPDSKIQMMAPSDTKEEPRSSVDVAPPSIDSNNFPKFRLAKPLPAKPDVPEVAHTAGVAIIAAMVNAEGIEIENEWVSISNFSPNELKLDGWALSDCSGRAGRTLSGSLASGCTLRVQQLYNKAERSGVMLNNRRGQLELTAADGTVVDRVSWTTREQRIREGVPLAFHAMESDLPPVRIIAALVNGPGDERISEWVAVINLGTEVVDLKGYALSDRTHHKPWPLDGVTLAPGESHKFSAMYESESGPSVQLGNRRGTIALLGPDGQAVDQVAYKSERKFKESVPVTFCVAGEVAMDGFGDLPV